LRYLIVIGHGFGNSRRSTIGLGEKNVHQTIAGMGAKISGACYILNSRQNHATCLYSVLRMNAFFRRDFTFDGVSSIWRPYRIIAFGFCAQQWVFDPVPACSAFEVPRETRLSS
jgi:hypothetical protein